MALGQTTGFVESLLRLTGLDWAVPDFSTICRLQRTLAVNIPYRGSKGPPHLPIDNTGIKVEGEGEWDARKHGGRKRRFWRKIHIGIDDRTLEIRAVEITGSNTRDAPMLPHLLNQIPREKEVGSVTANVPTTRADATTPSLTAVRLRSSRHAEMSSHGSQPPQVPSPGTTHSAHQDI